jgi:hypothetical protein
MKPPSARRARREHDDSFGEKSAVIHAKLNYRTLSSSFVYTSFAARQRAALACSFIDPCVIGSALHDNVERISTLPLSSNRVISPESSTM